MTNPNTDLNSDPTASRSAASADGPELLTAAEAESPAPGSAVLLAELAAARAKADEHWDQLLRARAELDNLRKRQALELEKAHKYALDSFVRELLPVQDSLELGHDAARDEGADLTRLREGTALTLKLLSDALARFGVVPVEPLGEPFNPEFHQAMTLQPRDDVAPNTVTTVMQKGYTLNGRLVRPALVMVSRAA
ncbi:MAG: nucleotide exchange factor GrpE [Lamprocystis purpurea]|jgi:molecular chaperone GrpE|uniref:nucleotide exchange factor GrpE n=1 Tax=Lamprocystis purpurea TaxID=61598 RepID=UPI000A2F6261|nr:nucleotide exchange factor GrpE [Lamprocystis purpurea]MBV5274621.1 nucleotide exchange factor GrpE [Lamprocystis purpurea]